MDFVRLGIGVEQRQAHAILAIPTTYNGLNAGLSPGTVVGIVLDAVGGFLLILWILYTIFGLDGGLSGFSSGPGRRTEEIYVEERRRRHRVEREERHGAHRVRYSSPRREHIFLGTREQGIGATGRVSKRTLAFGDLDLLMSSRTQTYCYDLDIDFVMILQTRAEESGHPSGAGGGSH